MILNNADLKKTEIDREHDLFMKRGIRLSQPHHCSLNKHDFQMKLWFVIENS